MSNAVAVKVVHDSEAVGFHVPVFVKSVGAVALVITEPPAVYEPELATSLVAEYAVVVEGLKEPEAKKTAPLIVSGTDTVLAGVNVPGPRACTPCITSVLKEFKMPAVFAILGSYLS